MINRVVGEEGEQVILLLLYADDVVVFPYDVDDMQHLLGALEALCHSGLIVNVDKIELRVVPTI